MNIEYDPSDAAELFTLLAIANNPKATLEYSEIESTLRPKIID